MKEVRRMGYIPDGFSIPFILIGILLMGWMVWWAVWECRNPDGWINMAIGFVHYHLHMTLLYTVEYIVECADWWENRPHLRY